MRSIQASSRPQRRFIRMRTLAALALVVSIMLGDILALGPTPVYAAPVAVGLGSYNTTLPAGRLGPTNSAGAAVTPKKTANVTGAMPTNDWWSSLGWQRYAGNPYSENMYAHPLALHAKSGGLGVSYPTNTTISTSSPAYLQEYHTTYAEDLMVGVAGLNSPDAKVDGFSDWTVTGAWSDGTRTLKATFGHGLPYVYVTKTGGDALVVFNGAPTIWSNSGGTIGATVNGHHYGIFGPAGAAWTVAGTTLQSSLAGKDYYSVAVLPDASAATLTFFKNHAYAFVTNTTVSWSYNASNAGLTTNYNATTTVKEGTETRPLLGLYRHQWLNTTAALTTYTYGSPRGQLKVLQGSSFSTAMTFNGVLPSMPDKGSYNRTTLYNYVNDFYTANNYWLSNSSGTYWTGKSLGRLAGLVRIAEQVGHTAARDSFLAAIKAKLQDWFQAPDGKSSNMFYYNSAWGTLIGYPAEYGSDTELNDHHFHYGYYVQAAATVAQYDPTWAADGNWGGMVKLLIKDAANWDSAETRFPRLRTFDPYARHSWAAGHAGFAAGNNQESSSESINFSAALVLWGATTGDTTIRDLGIYLYTNEVNAIEQYWFDLNDATFPAGFNHSTLGLLWGDGGAYATWFSAEPEHIHGINYLPVTAGSLYLGRNPSYITSNYNELTGNNGGPETVWQGLIWSFYALNDGPGAVTKFNANPGYATEEGESKAHTYHWIHNLNAMGQLDKTITANVPTYAVFNKAGTRTYVAYNPGSSATTVTFSNGATLSVPARSLAASGGTPGDTQPPTAPTNLTSPSKTSTSVSLAWTASTDNVGVTGYDIFNGAASAGSSAGTSFTVTGLTPNTAYSFTVKARDAAGNLSVASNAVNVTTNPGGGTGTDLKGEYYDNTNFTTLKVTRTDATVNFDWGSGTPDPTVGADTFSVRWTGQVQPLYSQTYTFYTTSDDGVRLWVNGVQLVNNWTDHGPTENSGTIVLTAGQKYDILIEYYENGGGAVAKLSWSSTSQAKQIIPQSQLYPAGSTPKTNTLYVIDGAAGGVSGSLGFAAGAAAATDTVPSAGGGTFNGTPNNPLVYLVSNVSGTYNSTKSTTFSLYVDAGTNVGDATQARVSYDFTGDGTYDRVETYNYFATNDVAGWEQYTQARGLQSSSGSFANLSNGRIRIEVWSAIGTHTTALRTSATAGDGSQSVVVIPFGAIQ